MEKFKVKREAISREIRNQAYGGMLRIALMEVIGSTDTYNTYSTSVYNALANASALEYACGIETHSLNTGEVDALVYIMLPGGRLIKFPIDEKTGEPELISNEDRRKIKGYLGNG